MAEGIGTCILLKNQEHRPFFQNTEAFYLLHSVAFPEADSTGWISYTKARIAAYDLTSVSIIRLVEFPRLGVIGRRFEKKGFWAGVTGT